MNFTSFYITFVIYARAKFTSSWRIHLHQIWWRRFFCTIGHVLLWNIDKRIIINEHEVHGSTVHTVAFSPGK